MNITTKDIIKILPFEDKFKISLLNEFDFIDSEHKFNIERILWDAFYAIYEITYQKNLRLAFERAKNNQEKLDEDFNKRVIEQTEKELQTEALDTVQKVDLEHARKAMEQIVQEIRASKAGKK